MRSIIHSVTALVVGLAPGVAGAVPVTYSFTAELTAFSSTLAGVQRSLESLGSREVTGVLAYDTDRLEQTDDTFILRSSLRGDGFEFEANSARILGSQAIALRDEPLDEALFFEFFEYELLNSIVTSSMQVDLFGVGLLAASPPHSLDVSRFDFGNGSFGWSTFDLVTGNAESIGGEFTVKSITTRAVNVPAPGALMLFAAGFSLLAFVRRRGPSIAR